MRILRINDENIDIDEKTAIGITFQGYDVKKPGQRKIKISNNFSIPVTSNNNKVLGFPGNPYTTETIPYDLMTCNYWIDNQHLIIDARVRIDSVHDRINLFIFQKKTIWDELKLLLWSDFVLEFLTWMQAYKSLPSSSNQYTGGFSNLLDIYINATEGLILPFYMGNFYDIALESTSIIQLNYANPVDPLEVGQGGHFCVFVKTVFEFIEYKYGVDFATSGGVVIGNIWDDPYAISVFTPIRDITIKKTSTNNFFFVKPDNPYLPLEDVQDKAGKSLYDFVNAFFQHFNIIIDELTVSGQDIIRLARFDDIDTLAEVIDWSENISGIPLFKPYINGYAQSNLIKFKGIYPEGDVLLNSRNIVGLNLNLDAQTTLFEIDAYIPAFIEITGGVIPDLSIKESFKTFEFFIAGDLSTNSITINTSNYDFGIIFCNDTTSKQLKKAELYSLNGEYLVLERMNEHAKYYELERRIRLNDVINLEYFKLYYFRELGGSFFLNKISGFNPQKSNSPTKIEVIKVNDKTPIPEYNLDYYVDGVLDPFTDGVGDYYI